MASKEFDVQQWIAQLHLLMLEGEEAVFAACFRSADELRAAYVHPESKGLDMRIHHPAMDRLLLNQLLKSGIWTRERSLAFFMADFRGECVLGALIRMDKCEAFKLVVKHVEKMRGRAACSRWLGRPVIVADNATADSYSFDTLSVLRVGKGQSVSLTPLCYAIALRRKDIIRHWLMMGLPSQDTSTVDDATVDAWTVSAAVGDGIFRYFHVAYKRTLNARRGALLLALVLSRRHNFPRDLVRHICEGYVWSSCCDECWRNR